MLVQIGVMLAGSDMINTAVRRTCTKELIRETDLEVAAGQGHNTNTCMVFANKGAAFKSLMSTKTNYRSTEKGMDATGVILTI